VFPPNFLLKIVWNRPAVCVSSQFFRFLCSPCHVKTRRLVVTFEISRRWLWRMPSSWMWRRVDIVCSHLLTLGPRSRIFSFFVLLPWRWRQYVPAKRRFMLYLHGAISQKTAFLRRLVLPRTSCPYEITLSCLCVPLIVWGLWGGLAVCVCVAPIVAKQRAVCVRYYFRFLYSPCRIKGKWAIISSQTCLYIFVYFPLPPS
jgi:hypothetical protein